MKNASAGATLPTYWPNSSKLIAPNSCVHAITILLVSVGPRILPYQTYFVRSGSMEPTIGTGSMVVLTKVDGAQLVPGDVIITGTTGGVGAYRTPPVWMKPGDVVEVEISGVGLLRNPIVQEQ